MMANLLSPITIKNIYLPNRIVMPAMATRLAGSNGEVTEEMIQHYVLRAQASVGLIIVEHTSVNPLGRVGPRQAGIYSEDYLEGFRKLTRAVHTHGGVIGIQISHGGTACSKDIIGQQPLGPSSVPHPRGRGLPREMTEVEIESTIQDFARAAVLAQEAGFDVVEVHGAHGYLLNQFLSPLTNKRSDRYGGRKENRLLFPERVVEEVRRAVGKDFPLFFRLGGDDRMFGGLTAEDAHWSALRLVRSGVDVIDLSGGLGGYDGSGQGYFVYLAEAVKPVLDIPIMVTGGIREPAYANHLIETGITDLVGIGRALLADPNWARKAVEMLDNGENLTTGAEFS